MGGDYPQVQMSAQSLWLLDSPSLVTQPLQDYSCILHASSKNYHESMALFLTNADLHIILCSIFPLGLNSAFTTTVSSLYKLYSQKEKKKSCAGQSVPVGSIRGDSLEGSDRQSLRRIWELQQYNQLAFGTYTTAQADVPT